LVVLLLLLESAALSASTWVNGKTHMHRPAVDWIARNVLEQQWVGAVQTGTVGYFHDRTINLDGKVNPLALHTLVRHGHVLDYVVDSDIDFIVDWAGMADWIDRADLSPRFAREFTVVLKDEQQNLGVLRRTRLRNP
jgi:hypothetical protein